MVTIDGNEATAYVAHKVSEVIAIYPITPSSTMGEFADEWSALKNPHLGTVPLVEMQSEGGAAGAVHGALQTGSLTTTFTASQGLLLMIPNMYKIAGELTSTVFHVSARALAAHALSIFGDQSDVMATRGTGFALLASSSVQEAQDMALIAHSATLQTRVPFLHFFDGFRTSHEVNKIEQLTNEDLRAMIDDSLVHAHRARALSPDHPVIRGTAQNPDVYFQARETVNPYYSACPEIVRKQWTIHRPGWAPVSSFRLHNGRCRASYCDDGLGAETASETALYLNERGEKVGVINVHLYRPFSVKHFLEALPPTVRVISVLDRCKEPGSAGEPLYLDVVTAINEGLAEGSETYAQFANRPYPRVTGGRYGLSSKEFTPAMVKGVFDEMLKVEPKNHFTIGIQDDVTHTSIAYDPPSVEMPETVLCILGVELMAR
jgi:pyruvate-ferredoxin/flavodoxin oxidoreductase